MSSVQMLLSGCAALFAALLLTRFLYHKRSAPYPPGPKGLPLLGNMFDMPSTYIWRTFAKWGQIYGDIVYVNILGQPMVILSSAKLATSMLDNKSSIYSDRPVFQMGGELVGWNEALAMKPYGQSYRERRRYIHHSIGSKALMKKHHGVLISEDKKFLKRLLRDHGEIDKEIRRTALAVMLRVTYGYTPQEGAEWESLIASFGEALETLNALTPGAWLVDALPFLRHLPSWVPGTGFKKMAAEMRKSLQNMVDVPYNVTKQEMNNGTELPPNLVADNLGKGNFLDPDAEHGLKWAAASIYSGGGDTTVSAIHTFILAMTLYPDVQKRAQAEIDAVIGDERLPSFEDRENLPFVEALAKEILRWRNPAPLTLPHRVTEDDIHDGYLIPKGAFVVANIWAILHDPEVYPNPDVFDPTRYLTETGEVSTTPDPYDACFGYGRRICPGVNFTDASIFIWCAMILSVYDISKAVGPDGKPVEPDGGYTSGTLSHPKPFKYSIRPRSEKAEMLIRSLD